MVKQIFFASDGTVSVGGTDITAEVTDISVTGGTRDVSIVRAFGSGTNAYFNEQPQEALETSVTYIKQDADLAAYLLGGSDGSEPYSLQGDQPRDSDTLGKSLIYTFTDNVDSSGAQLRLTFASIYGTSKEMSVSTGEFLEETFTFKCLPGDYTEEYTTDRNSNALP